MFALNIATWFGVVLLTPFWWGMGLLLIALLGDLVPGWRGPVMRFFDRLEGKPRQATSRIPEVPTKQAA